MKKGKKAQTETARPVGGGPQWLLLTYEPVSLFSLRMTHATNKGGKTLLVPTPYAFKLAMIDACFRRYAAEEAHGMGRQIFDWIKRQSIRFKPPRECIVQNTFVKIRQEERGAESGIYTSTIAYREWCFHKGPLVVALAAAEFSPEQIDAMVGIARHINYFGKRGCFWQFTASAVHDAPLNEGFTLAGGAFERINPTLYGVSQFLDDFGEALCEAKDGFERVSTYGQGTIRLGQHRVLTPTLLPYVRHRAARNFTHYRRTGDEE